MASTWFITGTSSGFGRHMTEQLLQRGDRVAATLRRPDQLDDLKAQYGDRLWVARLDVTDTAAVRETVDAAWDAFGRIDAVVSNAGYGLFGAVEEMTEEQIERQLDTNILGSIHVIRAAIPHLRTQGGGRILQVASLGGHHAFPGLALYNATKFAMVGFTEALRGELAPFDIGVTVVEPGSARTPFADGSAAFAPTLETYAGTPADEMREQVKALDDSGRPGDPARMATAMIAAADAPEAPVRLIMGSDATVMIEKALRERLAHVEEQRASAAWTDAEGAVGGVPVWA
jgi:NAD(P)-dependent dehydrogenase (short-subunit alcohol dehydrogenase family)